MKALVSLAGLVALATGQAASAKTAPLPCITDAEFRSVALFMLPSLVEGAANRCRQHLPADAYLLTGARRLADGIARDREAHLRAAAPALARVGGGKVPEGLSSETLAAMVSDMIRNEAFKKIGAQDCAHIDETAALLAPLPAENLVGLVALAARLGMKGERKPPFRFCATREI